MQKITSVKNPLICETQLLHQKKHRDKSGLFLAEGQKVLQEAIESGLCIKHIFSSDEKILSKFSDEKNSVLVSESVMKKLSTTDSIPEIAAIIEKPFYDFKKLKNGPIILLEGIQDPGNLGTIIRSACAFGVGAILLSGDTVDLYNPKVVRSTVGNLWKVPVLKMSSNELKKQFNNALFVATTLDKNLKPKAFYEIETSKNPVVMFGSEASGLSDEMLKIADEFVKIPMEENVESLNLSVSAGIIMQYLHMKKALA